MNKFIYALPVLVILTLIAFAYKTANPDPRDLLITWPMPKFETHRLWGEGLKFTDEDLPDTPHILHIFSSQCITCREQHDKIFALSNQHNIPLYAIAYRDPPPAVKAFLKEHRNPYKAIGVDVTGESFRNIHFRVVPTLYVVGYHKQVRYVHSGALSAGDIEKRILPVMALIESEKNSP